MINNRSVSILLKYDSAHKFSIECPSNGTSDEIFAYNYKEELAYYDNIGVENAYAFFELLNEFMDLLGEKLSYRFFKYLSGIANLIQGGFEFGFTLALFIVLGTKGDSPDQWLFGKWFSFFMGVMIINGIKNICQGINFFLEEKDDE